MLSRRSAAVAAAFAVAVASPLLTASAAGAQDIPWTQQTVFAIGPTQNYVAEWMGYSQGWTVIGGPASEVYAGSAGVFATNPTSGNIFKYNGTPGSWTQIGGPGAEFAEGGGHLYGLGPNDGYVAEWMGLSQGWTVIGGAASNIYAGPDGLVATAPGTGDLMHYNGSPYNWSDIGGPQAFASVTDVAVGSGAVYRVDPATSAGVTVVDMWTGGTTWTPILTVGSNEHPSSLIAGYDGVYLNDVGSTSDYYLKYNGTPNSWTRISSISYYGDGLYPMAESTTSLYGVTFSASTGATASSDVEIYSGTGSNWTVIGGPADPELAAGG
ncbi:MAG TPA: hypothetical protein VFN97_03070 [Actinospica sp.]|nr:hypothetical protein [Actinospica sp.]